MESNLFRSTIMTTCFILFFFYVQGQQTNSETWLDVTANANTVFHLSLEDWPIIEGSDCTEPTRDCFSAAVNKFFYNEFDSSLRNELNSHVNLAFLIEKIGNVEYLRMRNPPNKDFENEVARVIKQIQISKLGTDSYGREVGFVYYMKISSELPPELR